MLDRWDVLKLLPPDLFTHRPRPDVRSLHKNFRNLKRRKMMRVVDHEPHGWFLLEEDGSLFLDANCNHSFVGYDFLIELGAEEHRAYKHEGREFISRLATEIQDSAPIVKGSTSRFQGRDLSRTNSDKVTKAVEGWRASTQ